VVKDEFTLLRAKVTVGFGFGNDGKDLGIVKSDVFFFE
tara:strand:- start:554 stop:667 length:114 start_codon:yes stop_codon:yes gene_type:complete